ncbi:response regulator [Microbulbifer pacificus]|uniref:response regulator n=1 Tax=Microbulbifer pacificus TaxID=407164 RepID=UPI000CF3FF0C|nr:response regulator [Microbulbifer pacificus]
MVFAFPGESLLLETRLPLVWVLLASLAAIASVVAWLRLRARLQASAQASGARVVDLQAENAKLFRQVQARVHELMERDRQLEEARVSAEQVDEEHRDFLSLSGHRMRKPLETLVSTMSLLARGGDAEARQLAEAALAQCRNLRSCIEEIQRAGQGTPEAPGAAASGRMAAGEDTMRELHVLLVENDSHPSLRPRLEACGHKVRRETNGVDGAEAALRGNFDLVLIDVRLPLIDGVETARKIRGELANDSLIIFGMLDRLDPGDKERYAGRGLSGVLPSQPSDSQLLQLLNWVEQKTRSRATGNGKPARAAKVLNASTLERQRDTLGHLAFAELLGDRLANLPKKITAFTSALTGRHWLDAQHQAQAIAAEAESVGLEVVASRLKALSARLSIDSERDYCRHQRTEILGLMRNSIQQLKAWRENNVHTEWALR